MRAETPVALSPRTVTANRASREICRPRLWGWLGLVLIALSGGGRGLPAWAADPLSPKSADGVFESTSPAIAGFDRFARTGDLTAPQSARLLLTELSCTACHATTDEELAPRSGPNLAGLGNRVSADWLQAFLLDPEAVHPGTVMPDLLGRLDPARRGEVAEALVAYLESLRQPLPDIRGTGARPVPHRFWELGDVDRGRELYHRVGCVACHAPDPHERPAIAGSAGLDPQLALLDPEELEELGLGGVSQPGPIQPLGQLAHKHSLRSLALFLLEPETTRPALRMPNLKLTVIEAADLAMYLLRRDAPEAVPISDYSDQPRASDELDRQAERIEAGRQHFGQLGCAACHATPTPRPPSPIAASPIAAKPIDQLDPRSALACWLEDSEPSDPATGWRPWYRLDEEQRRSLSEYLAEPIASLDAESRMAERLLRSNCHACHEREGRGGVASDRGGYFATVGSEDLGDEGRLPPPLSGFERKLKPAWFGRVLTGGGDIRPHLIARMPKYASSDAKSWVAVFEQVQRSLPPTDATEWPRASDLAEQAAGRQMMDAGCVQCHRFRGEGLPGVLGIDLAGVTDRVQPRWFHDFVLHPAGLKPRTRMPTFFPDGISQNRELLDGDADRQLAAMWGYLRDLKTQPLPDKIEQARGADFELTPTERPILLRTFMRDAGPHAIAVGFPQGIHFAWDAEAMRLATGWKGRFLDAQGTWFVRSAPPAEPLGEALIRIDAVAGGWLLSAAERPDGEATPLAETTAAANARRFDGFRLDAAGVPTFLYRVGTWRVEDRIEPLSDQVGGGLHRQLEATRGDDRADIAPGDSLRLVLLQGKRIQPLDDSSLAMQNEEGLVVTLASDLAGRATIETTADGQRWVLSWPSAGPRAGSKAEVTYRW